VSRASHDRPAPLANLVGMARTGSTGWARALRQAVARAEVLVGGRRHLGMVPEDGRARVAWRSPLGDTLADIEGYRGRAAVVVLATGDPLWFGVGRLLGGAVRGGEVRVVPHVSAFQEAAARLGWALEEVAAVTLHGRPLDRLRRHLAPGRRVLGADRGRGGAGGGGGAAPGAGYGPSRMWVLEELAGAGERVSTTADAVGSGERLRGAERRGGGAACRAGSGALPVGVACRTRPSRMTGSSRSGRIRAVTLANLAPLPGELLWDVGCGAGGSRSTGCARGRTCAPSRSSGPGAGGRDPAPTPRGWACRSCGWSRVRRRARWPGCRRRRGVRGRRRGRAGAAGGVLGGAAAGRAGWWPNAVTLAGEAALLACGARWGGRLTRLALCRAEPLGGELAWRPALPLTQLVAGKPCVAES
jgi:precorrin-6Y C5,15-methyltransferase (decarboxylating)